MKPAEDRLIRTFTTLLEGTAGVSEVTIGLFELGGRQFVKPISVVTASGAGVLVSRSRLESSFDLHKWAAAHREVFQAGRVSYVP
ncbi:MAG: hypothetical protein DWQ34_23920 [Planctomycetota bacterium]|nr:MAG: hypothetical protein DWQ29_17900 [Planctomycetota bacterium]REJ87700.1 MAG: hypothetical protein DWQ34_23920 [Planctomycetota bacterium]REK28162.1 MAG: hypothetical protein DWQ41_06210 [Planctomycetota bacterium]REK34409.1 MAG: hypothetical protein DWQ45_13225 [Planctomycetota bacterium]